MIELFAFVFLFVSHVFFHADAILFYFDVLFVGLEQNVRKVTFVLFCDLFILINWLVCYVFCNEDVFFLCKLDMYFFGLYLWIGVQCFNDIISCSSGLYIRVLDLTFLFSGFSEFWFHVRISFIEWPATQRRLWTKFQKVLCLLVWIGSFNHSWRKGQLMISWLGGIEW